MDLTTIREQMRERISEQIDLYQQGENRVLVKTPFRFEDGDHFSIALKPEGDGYVLTDEASTIMHLSYWMDTDDIVEEGNRKDIVDKSLSAFGVQNRDGELVIPVTDGRFSDALFDFVQALTRVTDVSFLSREIVRSTFMEDLRLFLKSTVPQDRLAFNWTSEHDPKKKYPVDFHINRMKKPLFIYGIPNEDKLNVATINLLMFEKWGLNFRSVGVFEDIEVIPRKPLARFTDVVGKEFSNLYENKDRIAHLIQEALAEHV